MAVRPLRLLTILVLLAAAFPPPRVLNLWIAETSRPDSTDAKKTPQARGRNRIGAPAHPEARPALAPIASGEGRQPRPSPTFPPRRSSPSKPTAPAPRPRSFPAVLRLRC